MAALCHRASDLGWFNTSKYQDDNRECCEPSGRTLQTSHQKRRSSMTSYQGMTHPRRTFQCSSYSRCHSRSCGTCWQQEIPVRLRSSPPALNQEFSGRSSLWGPLWWARMRASRYFPSQIAQPMLIIRLCIIIDTRYSPCQSPHCRPTTLNRYYLLYRSYAILIYIS
jgi:hypothetical protein